MALQYLGRRAGGVLQRQTAATLCTAAGRFAEGDVVVVRECARGGKSALIGPLSAAGAYGSRRGNLRHSDIIGRGPRERINAVTSSGTGGAFMAHFPTLGEYVLLCSRRCTPIYPKDAAAIIGLLDAAPGHRILEAGTGNAGLTMHLARAVGPTGMVHTAERNPDTAEHARSVVANFSRGTLAPSITFHVGELAAIVHDIAESIDPQLAGALREIEATGSEATGSAQAEWRAGGNLVAPLFDGAVLDMPMPWTQLPRVFPFLKTDRYVVCYLPNMSQVMDLVRSCRAWPLLVEDVVEVDWREWVVKSALVRNPEAALDPAACEDAMVCRPTHTPIGHTAFLVRLRKCAEHART